VINTLKGHTSRVTKVKITADGNRIISGSDDATCIIWDLYSGKMIHSLKGHADNILALAITSDGKKCITGAHSDHCFIWDIDTGQVINNSLKRYIDENINSIVIAYDGRRRRSISLLKGYGIPKYPIADTYDLKITPDGKRAISLCNDITCGIWNMNSGKVIIALVGNSKIFSVAITPDGKRAITGSSDNKCILWNLNSGEAIKTFNGHTDRVISVAITPDGKRAISGSIDNTCIIWDLDTGEKVGLFVSTSPIYIVKFYFLGLLVGDRHGKISILKANKELLCPQYSIVTINRIWDFNLHQYLPMSAECPSCGHRFEPNILILNTIEQITIQAGLRPDQSPCLELTDEVWENPGLLGECPECHEKLKFNPFLGSDLTENENCIEASEILYSKMFDEAENAFNMRLWEKAYDLYLKLVQQGMYDLNIVYFNMAICQLNRLKTNREKIISDIKNLEALLSSKGKKREAQMITDKLNERLASIKPWWKKMF
jgi:WD40 repeat protein